GVGQSRTVRLSVYADLPGIVGRYRIRSGRFVVGPTGREPGTKGFAYSGGFPSARTISSPFVETSGVRDARACDQGHCSPQVVSAPSDGVPPAWLRVVTVRARRAAEVSLNSSRSRARVTARRHLFDESPALTN